MNLLFVKRHFEKMFNYVIIDKDTNNFIFAHHLRNLIPQNLLLNKVHYFIYDNDVTYFYIDSETEPYSQMSPDEIYKLIGGYEDDIILCKMTSDKSEYVCGVTYQNNKIYIYSKPKIGEQGVEPC